MGKTIVFDKECYENDEYMLFQDLLSVMKCLIKNGYSVLVDCDEPSLGIYTLEYNYSIKSHAEDWGCDRFVSLTAEEHEKLLNKRCCDEKKI